MTDKRTRGLAALILSLLLLAAAFLALRLGSAALTSREIWEALSGTNHTAYVILLNLRLPRMLAALLAGCGLSAAGTLLQAATDNDLCAPHIIGVNAGAGLAVLALTCFAPLMWRWQPLAAFLGAVAAAGVVLVIALGGSGLRRRSGVILAGVAVSSLLNAAISFLSLRHPDALPSYAAFSVGGFAGVSLSQLTVPAVMIGLCLAIALLIAPKLALLALGEEGARGLGVAVNALRVTAVLLSSALSAAVVSFAGLIGFVGLIVPHMTRRLLRAPLRERLGFGSALGALLTLLADLLGRTAFARSEVPAGIFLALLGGPFFIFLLIRKRKSYD